MANIQTSNITQNSFSVNWNYNTPNMNIVGQELIISGGPIDKRIPVIQENIQKIGSKSVSNLEPDSEYMVEIITNTQDENEVSTTTRETITIRTLGIAPTQVTANNEVPKANNTLRNVILSFVGVGIFALIVKTIKKRLSGV